MKSETLVASEPPRDRPAACAFEMVLGPGETPGIAEALMDAAKVHGAHLVSISAAHQMLRATFDREIPQETIVALLTERMRVRGHAGHPIVAISGDDGPIHMCGTCGVLVPAPEWG